MRPAVGLDRGPPEVGVFVMGIGDALGVPALADTFGTAAEDADVAGHRLYRSGHAVVLLAIGVASGSPGSLERRGLGAGIHVRQLGDVRRGHAAYFLGPLRRFRRLVVGTEDVVLEAFLSLGPVGHGARVHALHELIDELLVLQIVGENVVRHAGKHRRIGIGPDRNPPCVVGGGRVGVLRIDDDELAAALLRHAHVVEGIAAVEGVGRVPAPHDHQLGVGESIVLVAVLDGAEGDARTEGCALIAGHRPGVGAAAEHAEEARQQALDLVRLVQHAVGGTGIGLVEDCGRTVLGLQLDHLRRNVIERLVPGNALELALAAFADAHHRIEQSFGRIEPRAIGAAAQAGPELRFLEGVLAEGAVFLIAPVVRQQADNDVAFLVRHQHVARTAVVVATGHHRGELVIGVMGLIGEGLSLLLLNRHLDQAAGGRQRGTGRRRLDETAAARIQDFHRRFVSRFHGSVARRFGIG